jgi:hypothetical protein
LVAITLTRVRQHDNTWFSAVYASFPRAFCADHIAVFIQFLCIFSKVPDVAILILGKPVKGVFDEYTVFITDVVNNGGGNPQDLLGLAGDSHHAACGRAFTLTPVDECCPGLERKVFVVNPSHEVFGVKGGYVQRWCS